MMGRRKSRAGMQTPNDRISRHLIFAVLALVALAQAFDATCICVTLPSIASELDATVSQSMSLGTVFLLAATLAQPLFTEFSHVVGRKPAYLAALVLFIAGSTICGCAKSTGVLLAGRTIQGVGAGGPQPLGALILTDLFPRRDIAKYVSFLNVAWAVGTVLGPILGGAFTQIETIGWRWIFWINLPVLGVSFVGAAWLFGYDAPQVINWELLRRGDWIGLLLFVFSAGAVLTPLSWGGSRFSWISPQMMAPLIVGLMGFGALAYYETAVARKPMFRPSVFSNYSTVFQFICITIHGVIMWMILYYMSLFYLGVKGLSPLMTGVWALPATLTVAPFAVLVGLVVSKTGHYRSFLIGGWALSVVQLGAMHLIDAELPSGGLIAISFVVGIAMGALVPSMSVGVQATVSRDDCGHAIAMGHVLRSAGQCLGVAVGLSVFSTRLTTILEDMGMGEEASQDFIKGIRHAMESGAGAYTQAVGDEVQRAVVDALRSVWITGCCLASLALLLTLLTKCPRLPEDNLPAIMMEDVSGEEAKSGQPRHPPATATDT